MPKGRPKGAKNINGAGTRRPKLEIEIDLDNLGADELEDLMNDAPAKKKRPVPSLPRVAFLEREVSPPSLRERRGRA